MSLGANLYVGSSRSTGARIAARVVRVFDGFLFLFVDFFPDRLPPWRLVAGGSPARALGRLPFAFGGGRFSPFPSLGRLFVVAGALRSLGGRCFF